MTAVKRTIGLAVIGAGLAGAGAIQAAEAPSAGIPGYLNPLTGAFTPAPVRRLPAATLVRAGTIKIVVTLSIQSAIAADAPITCTANVYVSDNAYTNSASTSAGVVRSGGTGTCTMTIPYNWTLSSATDLVSVSFGASAGSYGLDVVSHTTGHGFTAFVVPANGKTTTLTLSDSI